MHLITEEAMETLNQFQNQINGEEWERLYMEAGADKNLAQHMWNKFHGYDHQIVKLFCYSENKNRKFIADMVNRWMMEKIRR